MSRFDHHALDPEMTAMYHRVRAVFSRMERELAYLASDRAKPLALTYMEEALMWVHQACAEHQGSTEQERAAAERAAADQLITCDKKSSRK